MPRASNRPSREQCQKTATRKPRYDGFGYDFEWDEDLEAWVPKHREESIPVEPEPKLIPTTEKFAFAPKTEGQERLIEAIDRSVIIYADGPAGSGKTFLAVAKAVERLKLGKSKKIVLLRPCIGVGGPGAYLPGTPQEKAIPFLRPLLDELGNFYEASQLRRMIEKEVIEITSLEYARGRTFKDSDVILDEAQNAKDDDFRVFLSRIGENSRYIITADVSRYTDGRNAGKMKQCDLRPIEQGAFETIETNRVAFQESAVFTWKSPTWFAIGSSSS